MTILKDTKKISNPLTMIAIFAALAETASVFALVGVDGEVQKLFVWFVMIFPFLLVILFFATLNFNPKVLYAPSDFRKDEHFIDFITKSSKIATSYLDTLDRVKVISTKLIDRSMDTVDTTKRELSELPEIDIKNEFAKILEQLERTKEEAENIVNLSSGWESTSSWTSPKIL